MKLHQITLLLFLGMSLTWSCTPDAQPISDQIQGQWELESAKRNGADATEILENVSFNFKGKEMITNIPQMDTKAGFTIVENEIKHEGPQKNVYKIEKFEGDKLVLSTKIAGYNFTFHMKKASPK